MLTDKQLEKRFYVKVSTIQGKGLFARGKIKKGEYMGEYNGETVTENTRHVLWVEDIDEVWRGRAGKNILRYINHSRQPLAEFIGFKLYAIKNIAPEAEITIDYGEEPV